jgi:enamine deaminase RidA (YjgF/YER057c/UK114 family)
MNVYDRLTELGITLATPTPPAAAFVPYVQIERVLYVSGHIARRDGKPWAGRLGESMTTAEGKEAARSVAVDLLSTLHVATGEDLRRIGRIVKLLVLVNSTVDFTEQHLVANGASELLQQVFGDRGTHARSAFGVAQLPFGSCVEIELIAEVGARKIARR